MNLNSIKLLILAVVASMLPSLALAQYEGYSTSRLLLELGEALSEARSAESRVKAHLATRDQFARELQTINRDTDSYQRDNRRYQGDLEDHNDDVDDFNAECGSGSFDQQGLDRCEAMEARLKTAQTALNQRRDALEKERIALKQRMAEYNQREQQRARTAETELARYDEINANIEAMLGMLQSKEEFRNSACFTRASPEARHQCLFQAFNSR